MNTPEILASITHTRPPDQERTCVPWQDVLEAMQGIDPWKTAYMLFAYAGDNRSRHSLFAGLFMEAMERPEIQWWIRIRKAQGGYYRDVETLCLIAIMEYGSKPYTHQMRAKLMGVSLSTWKRKYRATWAVIYAIPNAWEREVMEIINKRLR